MAYAERQPLIRKIEAIRGQRRLICFFNFDRPSTPAIPGLATQFHAECKESLFRILKETKPYEKGLDLCLYTRGGDTNSVWPLVNLLREFDSDFQVLVPFRCHSSGTLVALGAKQIVLGPLSELSPIDPSTGNQFNPVDSSNAQARLPISVEDVTSFADFARSSLKGKSGDSFDKFLLKLASDVHPLALGNVHRVHKQIKQLATALLQLHPNTKRPKPYDKIVESLATRFYSHLHMISRKEAQDILGSQHISFASEELAAALDELLREYENEFELRKHFFLGKYMGDDIEKEARFIGAALESQKWSYLYETKLKISQFSKLPPNVQVQLPVGQRMPLVAGLPREYQIELTAQGWIHNKAPQGVTL